MEQDKKFLGTEPIGKLLWKLAVPTVVAQMVNMLYNIVDRICIGHLPEIGDLALTGVGVCMPLIMIVSAFATLVGAGGAPRASISMGKGDRETAEKILGNCLSTQIIISVLLTAVLLIWNKELLLMFGASENTIEYATDYMSVYAFGTVFVQVTLGVGAFITAQGFTKVSMVTVLIGAGTNIVLDILFIFGFGMAEEGAALATIISQGVSCIWILFFLTGKKTHLKIKKKNLRIEATLIFPCLALGLSTFIMQSSESVISMCFNSSLLEYGGDIAVGAMTILASVMQFAMLPMQGIAQGAQPISSYNYGAGNPQRVRKTFKLLLICCVAYSTLMWAAIMYFPETFASIFTDKTGLIEFTGSVIRIYFAVMCVFGIQIACQMTFVSIGNAKCSIIVAIVRKFVLLLPLIYLLPNLVENKTVGVYMAEPVADIIAVTFTAILFAVQFKKSMKKIES